jgi:hypothetical protein
VGSSVFSFGAAGGADGAVGTNDVRSGGSGTRTPRRGGVGIGAAWTTEPP